jgi:hypothetical protein
MSSNGLLFGVPSEDGDQLIGTCCPRRAIEIGVRHVLADMVREQFVHQAVDRAACASDLVEDGGAPRFAVDGLFDRRHLSGDAANAGDELLFACLKMSHRVAPYPMRQANATGTIERDVGTLGSPRQHFGAGDLLT